MRRSVAMMLAGYMIFSGEVMAWWPFGSSASRKTEATASSGAKEVVTKKFHMSVPDKETEKQLLSLFSAKRMLDEDIRVLRRVLEDRKMKFRKYQEEMRKEFFIVSEAQYEYDDKDKTIYRLDTEGESKIQTNKVSKVSGEIQGKGNETAAKKKRVFHRKLTDEEEKRFGELVLGRRRVTEEIRILEQVLVEQQRSLDNTIKFLNKTYSMQEGRYYDYDKENMILYEVIPVLQKSSEPAKTR